MELKMPVILAKWGTYGEITKENGKFPSRQQGKNYDKSRVGGLI
jgi:hypothetical protein